MGLSTRTELHDSILSWLNRVGATDIAAAIPDFVSLAEARLNRDPNFRVRQMVKRATANLSDSHISLPPDFLELKQVQVNVPNGKPRLLEQVTLDQADAYNSNVSITEPRYFAIVGSDLEVVPHTAVELELEITYYAKVPALTADAPTNWLLTAWPDIYLYGALIHSAPYLRDDERSGTWVAAYATALTEASEADQKSRHAGSVLKTRARLRN